MVAFSVYSVNLRITGVFYFFFKINYKLVQIQDHHYSLCVYTCLFICLFTCLFSCYLSSLLAINSYIGLPCISMKNIIKPLVC